jgi:hypothetical protein
LSEGSHTLQVYANATGCVVSGIGEDSQYFPITGWSDAVSFSILPAPTPTVPTSTNITGHPIENPLLTTVAIAIIVIIGVIAFTGLLLYARHRKTES